MNNLAYFEIQANDPKTLVNFYKEIFTWKFIRDENIPIEYYRIDGAGINGAILKRPAATPGTQMGTNAYTCSVQIENYDSTAKKILDLGGIEALPKFAIPGKCWQGYFLDPDKNVFGIFQVDENAK